MIRSAVAVPPPASRRSQAPWLFASISATAWYYLLARTTADSSPLPVPSSVIAGIGLASQVLFTALEALLGVAVWAAMGVRVRWSELMPLLLTVSGLEALSVAVASGRFELPAPWPVLLAGTRAGSSSGTPSVGAETFAAFGALTLARLAFAAQAHAVAARVRWRRAACVVLVFYLASRCAVWWSLDLMRGHSFEFTGGG